MLVVLNETEQYLAKYIATQRYNHDRGVGAKATIYGNESPEFRELNSVGGEMAFCKLANTYPDLDPNHFGSEDCKLGDGIRVDVKTTTNENGRLLVKKDKKQGEAHFFALMIGSFPDYRYVGMIGKARVFMDSNIDNKLHAPAYAINQSELRRKKT